MNMQIKPIRTKRDYDEALGEIERLWEAAEGTPEADRLEVIFTLVEKYEGERFPIGDPDPVELIRFRLEQMGESAKFLEPLLGGRVKVWEVLNRRRPLTLTMIARLSEIGVPAEPLVRGTVATRSTGRRSSRPAARVAPRGGSRRRHR